MIFAYARRVLVGCWGEFPAATTTVTPYPKGLHVPNHSIVTRQSFSIRTWDVDSTRYYLSPDYRQPIV